MGHVDHGKSTLLDYIRKTNVVEGEAGGITQHISAYEVSHKDAEGRIRKITFLDTPGHEAFSNMRSRGAKAADIAILVVAADDGVNKQTKEVFETINESKTPYIVAINKIDKPGANIDKTKASLAEIGIYVESYGGTVSCVEVSAKTGAGIPELLETILLTAELEGLSGDTNATATGLVIESHLDVQRGISATLIIKNGTLEKGMFVVIDDSLATTRIFEDFRGKQIEKAQFSSPIIITGFSSSSKIAGLMQAPQVGEPFYSFHTKKEAEKFIEEFKKEAPKKEISTDTDDGLFTVPLVIKTDVAGTGEAIAQEISKIKNEGARYKIVRNGVGDISEGDLTFAQADKNILIIGFNVKIERTAIEANEQIGATIKTFEIIYKLTDYLKEELEARRPRVEQEEVKARIKVLKNFSKLKSRTLMGGRVEEGTVKTGDVFNIMRRGEKVGRGKIWEMQQAKASTKEVKEGLEFGAMVEGDIDVIPGDILETFAIVKK
jgi:translation initiation factor IF-2